jgi:hypothetical protein
MRRPVARPVVALALATALAAAQTFLLAGDVAASSSRQIATVMWHAQTGLAGPVDAQATATLVRRADGVSFSIRTANLHPGHAYTVWFVVINNPAECTATPCSGPDVILNPETHSQVTYGAGHISGGSGKAAFAGAFQAGPIDGWLPDAGLSDPMTAEIQLVLNDHGPKLTTFMPDMTHTYRAGCTEASIPGIFPASARADGTPGPNTCLLYQMAAFPGS